MAEGKPTISDDFSYGYKEVLDILKRRNAPKALLERKDTISGDFSDEYMELLDILKRRNAPKALMERKGTISDDFSDGYKELFERLKRRNPPEALMEPLAEVSEAMLREGKEGLMTDLLREFIQWTDEDKPRQSATNPPRQEVPRKNSCKDTISGDFSDEYKEQFERLKRRNPPEALMRPLHQVSKDMLREGKEGLMIDLLRGLIQWTDEVQRGFSFFSCFFARPSHNAITQAEKKNQMKAYILVTAQTFKAADQILQILIENGVDLVSTDPELCEVVLLFCVINHGTGLDVEAAMKKIPEKARSKPVFLVLLFHTRKEDFYIDDHQWSSKYKDVKFQTEVLFHQTKDGLFRCKTNQLAISRLVEKCTGEDRRETGVA